MQHFIGLDLAVKRSVACAIDNDGKVVAEFQVPTSRAGLKKGLARFHGARICLEVGSVSPWVSRFPQGLGHVVVACNPRRLHLIAESTLKCDRLDAEILARLARLSAWDESLMRLVQHRTEEAQRIRAELRMRRSLVNQRTACVNTARGLAPS